MAGLQVFLKPSKTNYETKIDFIVAQDQLTEFQDRSNLIFNVARQIDLNKKFIDGFIRLVPQS